SAESIRLTVAGAASSDSCARIASTIGGVICHQATRRGSSAPSIRASRTSAAACARRLPGASPATYASAGEGLGGGVAATSRTPVRRAVVRAFWAGGVPFPGRSCLRGLIIEKTYSHRSAAQEMQGLIGPVGEAIQARFGAPAAHIFLPRPPARHAL